MDANRPAAGPGGYGGLGAGSIVSKNIQPLLEADPRQIGPYAVRGRLGQGAMGSVYLGFAPTGQAFALKVLRQDFAADRDFRKRFTREIAAARAVHSPFVNAVTDADPNAATPWLASYFIPGPPLSSAVQLAGPFAPRSVAHLGVGIGLALQAIHTAGIVHRDLKPANVLVASDGPRVIDFGIARAVDASMLTATGMRLGTPSFMAPEQVSGSDVDAPADVWAVGGMLIYAATGRTPFGDGNAMAILYRVENHDPDLQGLEPALAYIAGRCLAKAPADRPTPTQLVEMCRAALSGGLEGHPALRGSDVTGWLPSAVSRDLAARAVELANIGQVVPAPAPAPAAGSAATSTGTGMSTAGGGKTGVLGGFLRRKGGTGTGAPQGGQPGDQYSQGTAMSGGQGQYGQPGGQTGGGQYGPPPGQGYEAQDPNGTGGQYGAPGTFGGPDAGGTGGQYGGQQPGAFGGQQPGAFGGQQPGGTGGQYGGPGTFGSQHGAPAPQYGDPGTGGQFGQQPAPGPSSQWGQQPPTGASGQFGQQQSSFGGSGNQYGQQPPAGQYGQQGDFGSPQPTGPAWGPSGPSGSDMPTTITPLNVPAPEPEGPAWRAAAASQTPPPEPEPEPEPEPAGVAGLPAGFTPIGEEAKRLAEAAEAADSLAAASTQETGFGQRTPTTDSAFGQPASSSFGQQTPTTNSAFGQSAGSSFGQSAAADSASGQASASGFGQQPPTTDSAFGQPAAGAFASPPAAESQDTVPESSASEFSAASDVDAAFGPPKPASSAIPQIAEPTFATNFNIPAVKPEPEAGSGSAPSGISVPSIAEPTFATNFNIPAVTATPDPAAEESDAPSASSRVSVPSIAPPTFATNFNIPVVTPTPEPDADRTVEQQATPSAPTPPPASAPAFNIPKIAEPTFATNFNIPAVTATPEPEAANTGAGDDAAESQASPAPTPPPAPAPAFNIPKIAEPTFATNFNMPIVTPPSGDADSDAPEGDAPATAPASSGISIPQIAEPTFATNFNIPIVKADSGDDDSDAPAARTGTPAVSVPTIAEPSWATGFMPAVKPEPPAQDTVPEDEPAAKPITHAPPIPPHLQQPMTPPPGFGGPATTPNPQQAGQAQQQGGQARQQVDQQAKTQQIPVQPPAQQAQPPFASQPSTPQSPFAAPQAPFAPPQAQHPQGAYQQQGYQQQPQAPYAQQPPAPQPQPQHGFQQQAPQAYQQPQPQHGFQQQPQAQPQFGGGFQQPPAQQQQPQPQFGGGFQQPPTPPQQHAAQQPPQPQFGSAYQQHHPSQPQQSPQPPRQDHVPQAGGMTIVPLPPSMESPYGVPERAHGPGPTLVDTDTAKGWSSWSSTKRISVLAVAGIVVVGGIVAAILALGGSDSKSGASSSPGTGGVTASNGSAQTATTAAATGPIGAQQGAAGARDVVLRGLYVAAANRDFQTVCASQTVSAQKGAAKGAGWNGQGDPMPSCEKYFQDNWSAISADYLRGRQVTDVKTGPTASTMIVTVNDPPPSGGGSTRSFTVVWQDSHWLLEAAAA